MNENGSPSSDTYRRTTCADCGEEYPVGGDSRRSPTETSPESAEHHAPGCPVRSTLQQRGQTADREVHADAERNDDPLTDGGTNTGDTEREAERFWSWYDIPVEYGTSIKVRRSGLSRGSWGDGRARDTVVHFHVQEAFRDGRLSRSADTYLCDPGSHVTQQAEEPPLDGDLEQKVTCETCIERMARWKLSPEEKLAAADGGDDREGSADAEQPGGGRDA